jgi:hypothetical protein
MSLHIKIILALAILAIGGLAAWHVQGLRAENARLATDNTRLLAVTAANETVIQELQAKARQDEQLLQQWAKDNASLRQTQAQLSAQIHKELKSNEIFKTWADNAYNPDAYRLLRNADSHRVSNN